MFYRREKPHEPSFDDRIGNLKKYGFETKSLDGGRVRVSRSGIAAVVTDVAGAPPHVDRAGLVMGDEIGILTHGGYQMFFTTPGGKRRPALADQLHALHNFEEDLREGLGLISLYNLSLGTIAGRHMYDRVEDRDLGGPVKPFIKKPAGVTA
jgi:hypothetical protein